MNVQITVFWKYLLDFIFFNFRTRRIETLGYEPNSFSVVLHIYSCWLVTSLFQNVRHFSISRDTYHDENWYRCGTWICSNLVSQMSKFQPFDLLNGNDLGTLSCRRMVHLSLFGRLKSEKEIVWIRKNAKRQGLFNNLCNGKGLVF